MLGLLNIPPPWLYRLFVEVNTVHSTLFCQKYLKNQKQEWQLVLSDDGYEGYTVDNQKDEESQVYLTFKRFDG